ncbi:MAG TPA: hypothetical protein VFD89_04150 [Clostridia bacterium]|nr:hypothetical protein [Clostridia bacterium]
MYFTKSLSRNLRILHKITKSWLAAKKIALTAILSALSAILQSAGGLLPGVGLLISPLATLPILLSTVISLKHGICAYLLTNILLVLIEPSELHIFAFTTGLLGLATGWGLRSLDRRAIIIPINGVVLSAGICLPLYILGFPILGPALSTSPDIKSIIIIFLFSVFYNWLWLELGLYILSIFSKFLSSETKS